MATATARLLAPTGALSSLVVVERDDWNGARGVIFNRSAWDDARQRPELANPGVYVLIGGNKAYVGEGDPVLERLRTHQLNRPFWARAAALTSQSGQFNKAHVQYLEAKLCVVLAAHYPLENKVMPAVPVLSEFDHVWAAQALANAVDLLRCFGFIPEVRPTEDGLQPDVCTTPVQSALVERNPGLEVLRAILDTPCSGNVTVRDVLRLADNGQRHFAKHLNVLGLKHTPGIGLQIPWGVNAPSRINKIFLNTLFGNGNWQYMLAKLDGVRETKPRFSGRSVRALAIPANLYKEN